MAVTRLVLTDFRNHAQLALALDRRPVVLVGPNGAGKTTTFNACTGVVKDADGKPADMTKKVKVFILLGQSNMVGAGKVKGGEHGQPAASVRRWRWSAGASSARSATSTAYPALAATYGRPVHLNTIVDPTIVGGLKVSTYEERGEQYEVHARAIDEPIHARRAPVQAVGMITVRRRREHAAGAVVSWGIGKIGQGHRTTPDSGP